MASLEPRVGDQPGHHKWDFIFKNKNHELKSVSLGLNFIVSFIVLQ